MMSRYFNLYMRILKNTHRSLPIFRPITKKRNFKFTRTDLKYDIGGVDQLDINKLCGISHPFRDSRYDSRMIGWNYNLTTGNVKFWLYSHHPSRRSPKNPTGRFWSEMACIHADRIKTITINFENDHVRLFVNLGKTQVVSTKYYQRVNRKHNRLIYPWFGGNRKAPKTLKFEFRTW